MQDLPGAVIGRSRAAAEIRDFARLAAGVDAAVLITGETGTGKGLLAAAIHGGSTRARGRLVAVNCAGVPDSLFESEFFGHARGAFTGAYQAKRGLFEQAHAGTLFLDEIGELSQPLQTKLLKAIEDGEVRRLGSESSVRTDARIIAATGVDIEAAVRKAVSASTSTTASWSCPSTCRPCACVVRTSSSWPGTSSAPTPHATAAP
jgi:transcriptional regulator with PAS, ATPase and Fis domain